jgi:hypothetical protein
MAINGKNVKNVLLTIATVASIISAEFGLSEFGEHSADYTKCLQAYSKALDNFCECVQYFNYYAKAHRIMERDEKKRKRLNINNVKVNDLVCIDLHNVRINYDPTKPELLFRDGQDLVVEAEAYGEARTSLPRELWKLRFRGKQQLEFLRVYLTKLKADRCCDSPKFFEKKGNVRLALSKENCISELSQYAETPSCLRLFLTNLASKPQPNLTSSTS